MTGRIPRYVSPFWNRPSTPVVPRERVSMENVLKAQQERERRKPQVVLPPRRRGPVSRVAQAQLEAIFNQVAARHSVSTEDLRSSSRGPLVPIRHEAMYLMAAQTGASIYRIAKVVHRNPSSIRHGIDQHAKRHNLPRLTVANTEPETES